MGETGDVSGRARVKAGLWRGMQWGAILSLYVTVISIVGNGRVLRQLGAPLSAVITGYLVGGALAGAILAALKPLRRAWWGRFLSGGLAGTVGGIALAITLRPAAPLLIQLAVGLLFGLTVGGLSGLLWLRQ